MSIRPIIKRTITLLVLIFCCFILHTAVFPWFKLGGVSPNIIIIMTSMVGFMRGRTEGMVVGFISGLLLDALFPMLFGFHALVYMFVGFFNGFFGKMFFGDDIKFPMLLVGGSDLLYSGAVYVFLFLLRQRYNFQFYFLNIIMPEVMYTVLICIIMYFPIYKLDEWLRKDDKRGVHLVG